VAGEEDSGRDSHGAEGIVIAGRYRLLERLGAGGMGRVWRAYDDALDCEVALKEVWLPPMLSDAERADRLARAQREARNAARLRAHPHIVSVHDMVSHEGMPWIVMDLIPSRNLAQVVEEQGPLPAEQVAKVGLGVLDALTASHAAGILHRDVKPPNVLLTTDGRVLLTDFGIAVQEADLTMTASGVLVGSPEFVAPERARGEASRGASDLFSLGATLYYASEGRSPFSRDTAVGVLTAILFEETAPVTRQPSLAPVINGLLVKDPAARWDAARARAELERIASGTPAAGTRTDGPPTDGTPGAATVVVPPGTRTGTGSSHSGSGMRAGSGSVFGPASGASAQGVNPFLTPAPPAGSAASGSGSSSGSMAPPTMAGTPAPPLHPSTPYPPTPYPPHVHQATTPYGPGPGYYGVQAPPKKSNTGRNVGIGAAAALVVASGIVAAIALSGGDKKHQDAVSPVDHSSSAASSAPHSSAPTSAASSSAGNPTSPSDSSASSPSSPSSPSDGQSSTPVTPPNGVDPATWDKADTDKTQFLASQLLPATFTDSKGVVYNATNQWIDDCVNSYESAQLKALLTKYKCGKQAISTYVDKDNKILVDIAVLPLADADTANTAFKDMQAKSTFTVDDWGVWCPRTGPGSDICASSKDTTNAQQYGYIQPNHRYLVHAVAMYVNLTSDAAAQDWLKPAATSAAKQGGPQVAVQ
jgi:serine/threonine protein kinase